MDQFQTPKPLQSLAHIPAIKERAEAFFAAFPEDAQFSGGGPEMLIHDLLVSVKRLERHLEEIEPLRAALKGYKIMLAHFEGAFLEAKAKLTRAHNMEVPSDAELIAMQERGELPSDAESKSGNGC